MCLRTSLKMLSKVLRVLAIFRLLVYYEYIVVVCYMYDVYLFLQVFYHLLIASFWAILYYFFSSQCMLFHNLTNHHHSCHHHCHHCHCHCHHCKHHHHYKGYERTIRFKVASKLLININFAIFFPSVLPILSSAYQFLILQIISLLLSWLMRSFFWKLCELLYMCTLYMWHFN